MHWAEYSADRMVDLLACLRGWKAMRCDEMIIDQPWETIHRSYIHRSGEEMD